MSDEKRVLKPNSLCGQCRHNLIIGARFKESDPWMALELGTVLSLITITCNKNKFHIAYGGDVYNIEKIKCLGCYNPEEMKAITKIAKDTRSIEKVKEYGESFKEVKREDTH